MRSIEIPQPQDRHGMYRFLEILPGLLSLIILLIPVSLAIISPELSAYFMIAYLLTWFVYVLGVNIRAVMGWRIMNQHRRLNWPAMLEDLEILEAKSPGSPKWHAKNIARVVKNMGHERIKPSEIYHAVIIALYNEPRDIIEPTIKSVLAGKYDHKKIIFFLAYEERGGSEVEKTVNELVEEYGPKFYHAKAVRHILLDGEIPGKGANITNAGRQLGEYIKEQSIDPLKVIVTTLDCDNRPDAKYLPALTYTYCSTEEPLHASYQPIPMFLNNIWDAPAPMRVIATGNSYWYIMLSTRHHMQRNFSSHAQSLATLIDTDYWSVRTVVEDGHQYWRTFFRYDGHHSVYPIYLPIYQDAVLNDTLKKTLKAQFYQIRRWAYGASDVAYVGYTGFVKKNDIPKWKIIPKFFRLLQGHVGWSTMPLILLFSTLPAGMLHPHSFVANQLPSIALTLQRIALATIMISLFISFKSLPPKPESYKRRRSLWMVLQWAYLPFVTIIYGSFAAINSQVRLAFGWYLGKFDLTEKVSKTERSEVTTYLKK